MNRVLPLLWAALSAAVLAQEPADTVTLLLKGGASVSGRVVRIEKDGVLLRGDLGGEVVERLWTWEQLDDDDPMKPARTGATPGLVAGVEVQEGSRRVRGVVVSRSADLLVVRDRDGSHRFDPSRVRVADVLLAEREVLDDGQLRARFAPPEAAATPSDHRRAAVEAARLGLDQEANDLMRVAEVLSELGRPDQEVFRRIGLLPAGSPERARAVWELRRRVLDQSYEDAIGALDRMVAFDPESERTSEAVRRELMALRMLPVEARIVLYHDASTAEALWALARNASLSWDVASYRVREELSEEVRRRSADRFSIDAEEARRLWERRPAERQLVASWGRGSFLTDGDTSAAAREEWWSAASSEERYAVLRALAAEVMGQVLEVIHKGCAGCGGRGFTAGRTCETCAGSRTERVVIYR